MASIGSVFLGDVQRNRLLASPNTPPSASPPASPPPIPGKPSFSGAIRPKPSSPPPATQPGVSVQLSQQTNDNDPVVPASIDPSLALDLRLRWLEAILLGAKSDIANAKGKSKNYQQQDHITNETLCRLAENVQRQLDAVVDGNEGLKRFMAQFDQHAHLLTPSFALSGVLPETPFYNKMSPEEVEALLAEMEPDIRAADRDIREIEMLEGRGVTGAGRLAEHEDLKPRLTALMEAQAENAHRLAGLESKVAGIVERHSTYVGTLSELFVEWDDTLSAAETEITRLEKERAERRRLGLEAESLISRLEQEQDERKHSVPEPEPEA